MQPTQAGATLGDTLTKPLKDGRLNLDRFAVTGTILAVMVVLVAVTELGRRRRVAA